MKQPRTLIAGILASLAVVAIAVPAAAQELSRNEQGEARREAEAGNQMKLRDIERRILPQMQGNEYLGPAYDPSAKAYRLRFIKDGRVTYVDVDARTGRIIGRSR